MTAPSLSLDPTFRALLFADTPPEAWGANQTPDSPAPWNHFARARLALRSGNTADAIAAWQQVIAAPDLESRHYLQAWHYLRAANIQPPASAAKQVLAVIVEASLDTGLDIVAAYRDLSARYLNYSGRSIIWEHPNSSLDPITQSLLAAGETVVAKIGPWDKPRPAPPLRGRFRLNFLTPSGLHFGDGPIEVLERDPMAASVITAAIKLMTALTDVAASARQGK